MNCIHSIISISRDSYKINFVIEAFSAEPESVPDSPIEAVAGPHAASPNKPSSSKQKDPLQGKVQCVLDVLPHLEPEFVKKLLTRYEDTESAIAAVLEGNLPPDLDDTVQLESESPKHVVPSKVPEVTDMMSNIDLIENSTRIITKETKSKQIRSREEKKILNEKEHVRELQSRYIVYSYISDDEYEDEYDDSYDAVTESETKSTAKNLKSTGAQNYVMDDVDDDESSESETEPSRDASKDFCENPEAVRERWARNRQAKFGAKPAPAPKAKMFVSAHVPNIQALFQFRSCFCRFSDVVGKPKGQGQEKSVVVSRHKKEANKSSRANHNRRQGAAFKRNRGMIPS